MAYNATDFALIIAFDGFLTTLITSRMEDMLKKARINWRNKKCLKKELLLRIELQDVTIFL